MFQRPPFYRLCRPFEVHLDSHGMGAPVLQDVFEQKQQELENQRARKRAARLPIFTSDETSQQSDDSAGKGGAAPAVDAKSAAKQSGQQPAPRSNVNSEKKLPTQSRPAAAVANGDIKAATWTPAEEGKGAAARKEGAHLEKAKGDPLGEATTLERGGLAAGQKVKAEQVEQVVKAGTRMAAAAMPELKREGGEAVTTAFWKPELKAEAAKEPAQTAPQKLAARGSGISAKVGFEAQVILHDVTEIDSCRSHHPFFEIISINNNIPFTAGPAMLAVKSYFTFVFRKGFNLLECTLLAVAYCRAKWACLRLLAK